MSTPQELLAQYTAMLNAFPADALKYSTLTIEWHNKWISRIQNALAGGDRAKMIAKNVPAPLIDSIADRQAVYLLTAAKRANAEERKSQKEIDLANSYIELTKIHQETERTMRYAYRADPIEMINIEEICKGAGYENKLDDLRRFQEIVMRKGEPVYQVGIEPADLSETLISTVEKVTSLRAAVENMPKMSNEEMVLMHRAYTWLMVAVSEVVACAEFLYGKDSPEFDPYVPEFFRIRGQMGATITNTTPQAEIQPFDES